MPMGKGTYGSQKGRPSKKDDKKKMMMGGMSKNKMMGGGKVRGAGIARKGVRPAKMR